MCSLMHPYVAYYLQQLAKELKKQNYSANLVLWNLDDGKGIDDTLSQKKVPMLKKLF